LESFRALFRNLPAENAHWSMTLAYFAQPLLESLVANGADQFSS
jgi:hypothetical protein